VGIRPSVDGTDPHPTKGKNVTATGILEAVEQLRYRFNGEVLLPGDFGYDERRKHFNTRFDKHPAVIVRPVNTVDVVAAVRFARATDLEIAISSGGKHMAGFSRTDGGVVIDLSLMRAVMVDVEEQTAWIQGGTTGGDLMAESERLGLGGVMGWMRGTAVGGVNLQGGWGPLSGKLGWGADSILELEMVTADGDVLRVSADENPDLFWAVRGAGGNFGVVTWIKQPLCAVPDRSLAGTLVYDAARGTEVLRLLDEMALTCSDDFTFFPTYAVVPADPAYPEELRGKNALTVTLVHIGDLDAANAELKPLRDLSPVVDAVELQPVYDFMCSMDSYIVSNRQWYDVIDVDGMSDDLLEIAANFGELLETAGFEGEVTMVPYGRGRNPDVPNALTIGRKGSWMVGFYGYWTDPADDAKVIGWADAGMAAVRNSPGFISSSYGNVQSRQDLERDRRSYGEENWKRLTEIKAKYDPDNVFHLNHNIPPA
jgi:FAD/FMN-containing dehydrogenase